MAYHGGYEKIANLCNLFDTKENIEFFFHCALLVTDTLSVTVKCHGRGVRDEQRYTPLV